MKGFGYVLILLGSVIVVATPFIPTMSFWPRNIPWWVGGIAGLVIIIIGSIIISSAENKGFQPDKQLIKTEDSYPCPVCGQKDFTWGMLASPAPARFRRGMIGLTGTGTPILSRLCNHCGNLIFFAQHKRP